MGLKRPIFERFPALRDRVPFRPLATLPTPVDHVRSLGLWVKRDDWTHAEMGGGKVRKMEFFRPNGPTLAVGPRGSNWLAAVQRFAPEVRIATFPQPHNRFADENARRLRRARHYRDGLLFVLGMLAEMPRLVSDTVRLAPPGGTDAVTTLAYVNAALELGEQVRRGECPEPDAIFVAHGSGGTAAGLALGLPLAGLRSKLFAVRIVSIARLRRVMDLVTQCAWLLDLQGVPCAEVEVVRDFFGGYARPIPAGTDAQRRFARDGLELDTTYTAKAGAAALTIGRGFQAPLLWLTHGSTR